MSTKSDSLEARLKAKLKSGDISQEEHDELYQKFTKLGLLHEQNNFTQTGKTSSSWNFTGSRTIEGGKINGPLITSGNLHVEGNIECNQLSVIGKMTVDGELTVLGKSTINGRLNVDGSAKFGSDVSSSGSIRIENDLFVMKKISASGKVIVENNLNASGQVNISSGLNCQNIKTTSIVRLGGDSQISEGVIAKGLLIDRGKFFVGGDILVEEIIAFEEKIFSLSDFERELDDVTNIKHVGRLAQKITKTIVPGIGNIIEGIASMFFEKGENSLFIKGNIESKRVNLANTEVSGDVIANHVVLRSNVVVNGKVKYRKTIQIAEGIDVQVEKLDGDENR